MKSQWFSQINVYTLYTPNSNRIRCFVEGKSTIFFCFLTSSSCLCTLNVYQCGWMRLQCALKFTCASVWNCQKLLLICKIQFCMVLMAAWIWRFGKTRSVSSEHCFERMCGPLVAVFFLQFAGFSIAVSQRYLWW